jgi:hypothetical protein
MTSETTTPQQRLEAEKALIDSMTDTTEQALASAALRLKIAAMKGEKGAPAELTRANKALADHREQQAAGGDRFKNLAEASRWIVQQGYLVSERNVSNHSKFPGFPHKQKDGSFIKAQVEEYAARTWDNPTVGKAVVVGQTDDFKTDIQRETARKLKMANDERNGTLVLRSQVEQELSSRLAFLKRDLYNLGPRAVDTLVEKFSILIKEQGVDLDGINLHALISDMEQLWDKNIAGYLDSYARPRGFLPALPQVEESA